MTNPCNCGKHAGSLIIKPCAKCRAIGDRLANTRWNARQIHVWHRRILDGATLAEVGKELAVTPERIRQIQLRLSRYIRWSDLEDLAWRQGTRDIRLICRRAIAGYLYRQGLCTVGDLQGVSTRSLLRYKNVGPVGILHLAHALISHGEESPECAQIGTAHDKWIKQHYPDKYARWESTRAARQGGAG